MLEPSSTRPLYRDPMDRTNEVARRRACWHRGLCGENGPAAKLTNAEADKLRTRHRRGESLHALARRFGVDRKTARAIVRRETYACHLSHPLEPKVIGAKGERRLICRARGCGEPIVGAYLSISGAWVGGVHQSDVEAGRYDVAPSNLGGTDG